MNEKAERLIGTTAFPAGLSQVCQAALEAQAYHVQEPYPGWYFRDWRVEERGPLPRCMPVARRIVTRGGEVAVRELASADVRGERQAGGVCSSDDAGETGWLRVCRRWRSGRRSKGVSR